MWSSHAWLVILHVCFVLCTESTKQANDKKLTFIPVYEYNRIVNKTKEFDENIDDLLNDREKAMYRKRVMVSTIIASHKKNNKTTFS